MDLTDVEVRVLGCLMEKQVTTPDQYPLTVNALVSACNQSTNRWPVVAYGEGEVTSALTSLRQRGFTRVVYSPSNRAPKHRHVADEAIGLAPDEQAAITVLALRGPQTVGEVKGRTERLYGFVDLADVEATLDRLADRADPLVVRLPRQPGQKDARYCHLLNGPVDVDAMAEQANAAAAGPVRQVRSDGKVEALEQAVAELTGTVAVLSEQLDAMTGIEARLARAEAALERLAPLLD